MRALSLCLFLGLVCGMDAAAEVKANYDEAKVGDFPIPDPLLCEDGTKVTSPDQWMQKRRPELMKLFEREVYGKTPEGKPSSMKFTPLSKSELVLDGKAVMTQTRITFSENPSPHLDVLLVLPVGHKGPAPVFVSLDFGGNQSVATFPSILMPEADVWFRNDQKTGYLENKATDKTRGSSDRRWPLAEIVARGYGVATAYYGDTEPDRADGFDASVRKLFLKQGQDKPADDDWGAIGAWAWSLSRMADFLATVPEVNSKRLAVVGHSRLGKTALWAGAQDERFGIVISNDSGCGGAALSKRIFGETVGIINRAFPHWFCTNFKKYDDNEGALPVDQHELIALVAPRPVYIASATEDLWADPKGEFMGGKLAEPVYALFGKAGLGVSEPPGADKSVGDFIGYHARTGKHDILLFDWEQYMNFADRHWGKPE
jgi:hypothetical protein